MVSSARSTENIFGSLYFEVVCRSLMTVRYRPVPAALARSFVAKKMSSVMQCEWIFLEIVGWLNSKCSES